MGTWGPGLFDDDTGLAMRELYLQLLAEGRSVAEATEAILTGAGSDLDDPDEGPVIWLALAATQWEYGAFGPRVQEMALGILELGEGMRRWDGNSRDGRRRRRILTQLAAKLRRPPPRARKPRRRKERPPVPGLTVTSPDGRAKATVYQLTADPVAAERCQVICEMEVEGGRGGGHVALLSCAWDAVGLDWLDPETLRISHPAGALVAAPGDAIHDPKPAAFYGGRTIAVKYLVREGHG